MSLVPKSVWFSLLVVLAVACGPKPDEQLATALEQGDVATLNSILEAGANPNLKLGDGATPLMIVSGKGLADAVDVLITAGAAVNAKDLTGQTALVQMWGPRISTARRL